MPFNTEAMRDKALTTLEGLLDHPSPTHEASRLRLDVAIELRKLTLDIDMLEMGE